MIVSPDFYKLNIGGFNVKIDYLNDIKKLSKIEEIEDYIRNIFIQKRNDRYIPAIINEGKYTIEFGEDFYLKLVEVECLSLNLITY